MQLNSGEQVVRFTSDQGTPVRAIINGDRRLVGYVDDDNVRRDVALVNTATGAAETGELLGFVTGASDHGPALQALFDSISTGGVRTAFSMPRSGMTIRLLTGIVLDASRLGEVDFRGALIDASGMTSGTAIRVSSAKDNTVHSETPYDNALCSVSNFKLLGPGYDSNVKGVQFNQPTGATAIDPGPSRTMLRNFIVDGFATGIDHFNRSYGETFINGSILHCGSGGCVAYRNNPTDAGEAPSYFNCFLFNSSVGVNLGEGATAGGNNGTWLKMFGCHIDYNPIQIKVANGAKLELFGCHLEADATHALYPANSPITVSGDGSIVRMIGGQLVFPATSDRTLGYIVDNSVPAGSGGAFFDRVDFYRCHTTTDYFATGVGDTQLNDITSISTNELPLLIAANRNAMCDGGFEASTSTTDIKDLIFITADTAAITNPVTGTNLTIVSSSSISPYHGGARALRVNKAGAGATSARFVILVPYPVGTQRRGTFRGFFRKSVSGTIAVQPVYATVGMSLTAGVPAVRLQTAAETAVNFTSTAGTWIDVRSVLLNRKSPLQAAHKNPTHYGLFINLDGMASHNLDIDDLEIDFI